MGEGEAGKTQASFLSSLTHKLRLKNEQKEKQILTEGAVWTRYKGLETGRKET